MGSNCLELVRVSYAYRRGRRGDSVPALRGVSCGFPAASVIGLIGPNGAGKTTACKMVNGILRPVEGAILWDGEPIEPHRRPGQIAAYSFQNPDDQLFAMSVRAELQFGPRNLGLSQTEVARHVDEAVDWLGIRELLSSQPLDLPFVLRKRVCLAAALSMGRPLTILDEPALGQDNRYQNRLRDVARAVREAGRTLVVVSHEPEFVFSICDRLVLVEGGHLVFSGLIEEYAGAQLAGWPRDFLSAPIRAVQCLPALDGVVSFDKLRQRLDSLSTDVAHGREPRSTEPHQP